MKLTHIAIKNAKPKDKLYKLSDSGGLQLHVNPNGSKLWRLAYRYNKKQKLLALGRWPEVSLKAAREKRDEAKRQLAEGIDPSRVRRLEKCRVRDQTSFEAVARDFIARQKGTRWKEDYADDRLRRFELDIFPYIGDRPIDKIEPPDLLACLRRIESRGAHEMAAKLRRLAGQVFRYGIACGFCSRDPAADLRDALTPYREQHLAAVKPEELPDLMRQIDGLKSKPVTRLGLQFLALTFVRTSEMIGATWDEFDFDKALWIIPAKRMKVENGPDHMVPLARQTIEVLNYLRDVNGHSRYLFARRRDPNKPISNNTCLYALYRLGYKGRMTGHGFRSVASTALNESGLWTPDAIERQLAHYERNKVRGAYNRAEYLDERRRMMQWWADELDACRQRREKPAELRLLGSVV